MIHVCDAIMGSGKTSAAITYMNEHKEQRFVYITPLVDETKRIKTACPDLHFVLPNKAFDEYEHQKRMHFKHLLSCGENIATTHVLFSLCDDEAIQMLREQEYVIIIDEAITVLDKITAKADDVKMALNSEWFQCGDIDDGEVHEIVATDKEYTGSWARDLKLYADSHRLVALRDEDGEDRLYCWMFNQDMLLAAKEVFVLTYLFPSSPMYYLFQMHNIQYSPINVARDHTGRYYFSETEKYVPEYTKRLAEMIHIERRPKMNKVGQKHGHKKPWSVTNTKEHLSHRSDGKINELKHNLDNYFNNIHRDKPSEERLWTCYSKAVPALKGAGYASRYLAFNAKATNDYKHARVLAYCINVFMPMWEANYYRQHGLTVDERTYALSVLIQWIWRSAIRDGEEIWIYVPVQRMRDLLDDWIADVVAMANEAA